LIAIDVIVGLVRIDADAVGDSCLRRNERSMAIKRSRSLRRRRQQASGKTPRYNLPWFEPYRARELQNKASRVAEREGIDVVNAMYVALHEIEEQQVEQVLKSLQCDPSTPDWRSAFFKLARLCCNVGRVRRARGGGSGTRKWTTDYEFLMEMRTLVRQGLSERGAIRKIANDPAYDDVFPTDEQRPGLRVVSRQRPRRGREDALRKRWELLKQRIKSDSKPLERQLGLTTPDYVMSILSQLDIFPNPSK
jgi:hypothetical protein